MILQRLKFRHVSRATLRPLCRTLFAAGLVCFAFVGGVSAQTADNADSNKETMAKRDLPPDLTKNPTLYVVGYAHLDTEWRWEYPQVINEYLRKTEGIRITFLTSVAPIATA